MTFDIDANGIVHVSARDKSTGKEQKVTIQSSGGLSKEEIEKMVKQAEQFKEEDAKRRELVDLKNEAYNVHETTQKQLDEFRSKLPAEEVENIEKSLKALSEWKDKDIKTEDVESVKKAISEARNAAMKIGQVMYNQQQSGGQASSGSQEQSQEQKEQKEGQSQEGGDKKQ